MAEIKESSVLFSLNQLMGLEQQRLREEEDAARICAEAEVAARVEREVRAREAETARIRAEEERRRVEEAARREEAARLDAMRLAQVEKARVDAEQRARIAAMEKQQEHEREMATIAQDHQKRRLQRFVTWGSVAGVLALAGSFGLYFGKLKPDAELAAATQAAEVAAQERRLAEIKAELEKRNTTIDELAASLVEAKNDIEKSEIERKLAELRRERDAIGPTARQPVGTKRPPQQQPTTRCNPGDPLCNDSVR